jgi:hypothetical protein
MKPKFANLESSRNPQSKQCACHQAVGGMNVRSPCDQQAWRQGSKTRKQNEGETVMKSSIMTFLTALAFTGTLALALPGASLGQNQGSACAPHYDSSGAQKPPYC